VTLFESKAITNTVTSEAGDVAKRLQSSSQKESLMSCAFSDKLEAVDVVFELFLHIMKLLLLGLYS